MSLETERFGVPTSLRAQRVEAFERERAVDQLAGRTVWCAGALGRASERASGLRERLGWAHDGGVDAAQLQVHGTEPLREAAAQLESMLNDLAGDPRAPGRDERALYTERTARAEEDVAPRVRAEDVVVLHDPLSAAVAHAVRERGGHALWHVRIAAAPCGARSEEAWTFLREFTSDMNAYLVSWSARGRSGGSMHRIAALMPSSGVGFVKEFTDRGKDLAWSSLLADVLEHDRVECVGGTLHVRPTVAAR